MLGLIERLRRGRESTSAPPPCDIADSVRQERRLADLIARAAAHGHERIADRLTTLTNGRVPCTRRLTEELARQHLRSGRIEAALRMLERPDDVSDSTRLLHAICLTEAGRRDEAAIDLAGWAGTGSAPIDALLMLAQHAWDCGDLDAAASLLHRAVAICDDALIVELLLLLAIERKRPISAARWFERLRETTEALLDPERLRTLAALLELPDSAAQPRLTMHSIRRLAQELAAQAEALPALTKAVLAAREPHRIALCLRAVEHPESELAETVTGFESRVRSLRALGAKQEAEALLDRALLQHPRSAPLHMLRAERAERDQTTGKASGEAA